MSVRVRLALSYAGLVVIAGTIILAVVALRLLYFIPDEPLMATKTGRFVPNRSDILKVFTPYAAWSFIGLLILGVVGGWFLAGRMLRPLNAIGDAARRAAAGSLSHRIAMPGSQDEFRELADVFDAMLTRIEGDVERQRRFAANASHELRTPLSVTRALIDVAGTDPDPDIPVLLAGLRRANDRAVSLTEALLLLARVEARPPQPVPTDLSLAAEEAEELLHTLADEREVRIDIDADAVIVAGDQTLLNQLATNLLQNAIVHNLPEGGTAWIRTIADDDGGRLVVENTGRQLDPALVATLTEPFQRGAQRARGDGDTGSGLGLAIAASIVEALHGRLELHARTGGGLRVEASFPAVR